MEVLLTRVMPIRIKIYLIDYQNEPPECKSGLFTEHEEGEWKIRVESFIIAR